MNHEWRGKLLDSLAMGAAMVVVNFAMLMLVSAVERLNGKLGLLVLAFTLMAGAIFCLERATTLRFPESWRARSGIFGGMLAWTIVEVAIVVGGQEMNNSTETIVLTLAILVAVTLWRRSFSTGLQFFVLTFLFGWMGRIILGGFMQLQNGQLAAYDVLWWAVIVFGTLGLGVVAWTMLYSRSRIQRLMVAVMLWFCLMVVIYSMRGGIL